LQINRSRIKVKYCEVPPSVYISTLFFPSHRGFKGPGGSPYTIVPPYPWVISCKTYRGYVKPLITANAIYRMSQKECARLRESVPYVKVYRYKVVGTHVCDTGTNNVKAMKQLGSTGGGGAIHPVSE
jgi:hypothetical protein